MANRIAHAHTGRRLLQRVNYDSFFGENRRSGAGGEARFCDELALHVRGEPLHLTAQLALR